MRSFLAAWSICLVCVAVLGYAADPQTSGTVADARLQADVMQMIGKFEAAAGRSTQPKLISASRAGQVGSTVVEHWIVESNGKKFTYDVALTPSRGGGVDYRVRPQTSVSTTMTTVTLKDGKTYAVETVRGLPVRFASEQIKVQDLYITARLVPGKPEVSPYVRELIAELLVKGQFAVTITSPLDSSATTILAASGPGRIVLRFFPQAEFRKIWEGIDSPGIHWFPFHFVFEDKQSGSRFEFTQWAQHDEQNWRQTQEMVEKAKQQMLKR